MGLPESGLLGQAEAGQFAGCNAIPQDVTKILLQDFELHGREYSTVELRGLGRERWAIPLSPGASQAHGSVLTA